MVSFDFGKPKIYPDLH